MCPTENQLAKFLKSWIGDSRARTDTPNIQHRRRQVTHLGAYYSKYHYTPTRREHAIRIKPLIAYLDYYIRTVRVN